MAANRARLPRATPESQGVSSAAIRRLVDAWEAQVHEIHSFMLVRHGRVVAEGAWSPYDASLPQMLFSLSKSFTSTAVGLAIAEKRLSLDDTVVSYFPDDLPARVSPNLSAMRIRHLLAMVTGHAEDSLPAMQASEEGNWPRAFLALPVEHAPGTYFLYDTGASYMLSAIVQRLTGEKLVEYLEPRLFEPLGIEGAAWEEDPGGVNTGGYGLMAATEDIAAFGQCYLQRGEWNGRQLVPADWVAAATAKQSDTSRDPGRDWSRGYGYQFWQSKHGYRGDGAFGQYCIVLPEEDAVLAITSGIGDMQPPLDLVWELLVPALGAAPLPEDPPAADALATKLRSLAIEPPAGGAEGTAAEATAAAEATGRTYEIEPNPLAISTLRFDFTADGCRLTATDPRGEHRLEFGWSQWRRGETTLFERPALVAAAGAWTEDGAFTGVARAIQTPFYSTIRARLEHGSALVTMQRNVDFGPTPPLELRGAAR